MLVVLHALSVVYSATPIKLLFVEVFIEVEEGHKVVLYKGSIP